MTSTRAKLLGLIPWAFVGLGILIVSVVLHINQQRTNQFNSLLENLGKENNSYLRTMVCIASVSPTRRTPDYVAECYDKADEANNVELERFGDGLH